MSKFNQIGGNATLEDFIRERRNDAATVDALTEGKVNGRDRTGFRAVPVASGDARAGDRVGDYVRDFSTGRRYEFVKNNVTLQWVYSSFVVNF